MNLDDRQLAKLTIEPYQDQAFKQRAGLAWQALFNPTELSFTRKANYHTVTPAGASAPQLAYGSGEADQVQIELLFDGTGVVESALDVGQRIDALLAFTELQPNTHQPYYLHAHWGRFDFRGVLTQADVNYKLFDRAGQPLRATVKVSLKEAISPEELSAKENRRSPDLYQTWTVSESETLDAIAHQVYGSPDYWRPLAEANRLVNPRALFPGQSLVLPPKEKGG